MTRPTNRSAQQPTTLTARSPEDVLAAVPVVLGFEPRDSVVMLTFGGAETFHARVDLSPAVDEAVTLLLEPALQHRVARVLFVVYADEGPPTRAVTGRLRRAFTQAGIEVVEVLRVHEGRWFAPGRPGAPPSGVPYDVGDHRFRAQAVVEGIVVHSSRAELEGLLRPRPEAVAELARAVRRAVPSPPDEIADLVDARLEPGRFATAELARVLLGMTEPRGRDAAWAAMSREVAVDHLRLWTDTVQRAPEELVAAPAAVLALAAWLAGQGALAWCAVDRCAEVEPDNSLAGLVADALTRAVPPSAWTQVAS
jgi:predicted nucleic acid-binding protein